MEKTSTVARAIALFALVAAFNGLRAQSFEVATIKPAVPDAGGSSGEDGRNGSLRVYNVSLKRCIRYAYGIPEGQIVGGPDWIDKLRFDITAKASYAASERELLKMLQPFLGDRFRLKMHHETRPMSGYILKVSRSGMKAKVSEPNGRHGANGARGRIDTVGTPVAELVIRLTDIVGRPVIDNTGETREFDFHLRWTPDDADPSLSDAPSLFTALQEQTGLNLAAQSVPADVLVIDHAEMPSDN